MDYISTITIIAMNCAQPLIACHSSFSILVRLDTSTDTDKNATYQYQYYHQTTADMPTKKTVA